MPKARARNKRPNPSSSAARGASAQAAALAPPTPEAPTTSTPVRYLPGIVALGLVIFVLLGGGPDVPEFRWSVLGAAVVLVAWNVWLLSRARGLAVVVELRPQHYVQIVVQSTVLLYWGLSLPFPLVRDHYPLLAMQIAFAYGFDLLLAWTTRGRYSLGFGPFPVIFSINLFLWFKAEWFFLQFVIIAAGFAAKGLIQWTKDGRKTHIFNPSSFPLAVASVFLILTASTDITYGEIIASSQNNVPHMYLLLFMIALPGQLVFGVASMTVSAVLTTYLFGLVYRSVTGTYFFFDCDIPVPIFLGMHLLFTDPSTAPRTELGRIFFGVLYGLTTVLLYYVMLLGRVPTFYDKLLQVPLLNLSIQALDRMARSPRLAMINPERLGRSLRPRLRYVGYASIWAGAFIFMISTRAVGDRHPGQWWPYWIQRCERGNQRACAYLATVDQQMCRAGSGWACNEAAILGPRSDGGVTAELDRSQQVASFQRGCNLGFRPACVNNPRVVGATATFERAEPTLADYKIILRGSRLLSIPDRTPTALFARACAQGWPNTCGRTDGPTTIP